MKKSKLLIRQNMNEYKLMNSKTDGKLDALDVFRGVFFKEEQVSRILTSAIKLKWLHKVKYLLFGSRYIYTSLG